jgi:RNA polymerase sigma-70 factor (ECF subfamily)
MIIASTHPVSVSRITTPIGRETTQALMQAFLHDGNTRAYEQLFRHLYTPLCRYCRGFVQAPEVAEEVVGDVFFAVWKNRTTYTLPANTLSYFFVATRNRAYDYLRKTQRARHTELDTALHVAGEDPSSQLQLEAAETDDLVRVAIDQLPASCKQIFTMSRDLGMKYQEIADNLGLSVKTVETQMGRALKHLRAVLLPA